MSENYFGGGAAPATENPAEGNPAEGQPVSEPAPGTVPAAEPTISKEQELEQRNLALQSSLDSALEELANKGRTNKEPEIIDKPEAKTFEPIKSPEQPPKLVEPEKPAQAMSKEDQDNAWKKALDEKEKVWNEKFEDLQLRDEMISLTTEIQSAIAKFPYAKERDILLACEAGSDKSVSQIAEELHNQHNQFIETERKIIEEKVKAELLKEKQGGISIPQSSGSSSAPPNTPNFPGEMPRKVSNDTAWAMATKEAKANIVS
jgi:hypothetical protein